MTGHEKALIAEYVTVGWNVIEGIVAIMAGIIAGSIALIGFGLDSYIEVASGIVLIWRLRKHGFADEGGRSRREKGCLICWRHLPLAGFLRDLRVREETPFPGTSG